MKKNIYKKENPRHLGQVPKFWILLMMVAGAFDTASATVASYTFASSPGTYTAITGTTLFSGTWDDVSSGLLTIPFSFTYNNVAYTTLGVTSNGFITMGATQSNVIYCGIQNSPANSIAGYGTDLVGASASSTVIYTIRGSSPNRQFVIQWTDCDHYNTGSVNHWTFQIILNETSNSVQVVWGSSTDVTTMGANSCSDAATESGNVGLRGNTSNDFNIRSVANGINTWASSAVGNSLTAVCNMSSSNIPASGLTYTWTPGAVVAMTYTSSTATFINNGLGVHRSAIANQVLQVQVVTSGSTSSFNLTSLSLSTTGCTNASTDIANAKVYFTGVNPAFSTTTQFGSTATSPNGAYTVFGSATLLEGTNYFWVTYDITSGAPIGDILSGCCNSITGSGTMGTRTPTVTCPSGSQIISQQGIWTPVNTAAPHTSGGGMLLLSDGAVLAKSFSGGSDGYGNVYDKLIPDINGSYINGTWSSIAPMHNTRLYYSSQVLKDGRIYVAGGEYGTGGSLGETYDPLTNVWTNAPAPGATISDANSEILPDGKVLQALVSGNLTGTDIYNPVPNTYANGPTALGIHNESAWVKLPDNSILYVNRLSTNSERYIPSQNQWIADATVPVSLYDPYGDETGAGLLLPDGRVFFLGSSGHTAFYTPSGNNNPGSWAAGPDIPGAKGTPDAPAALMVDGKVLCAVSPVPTSGNHFPTPTSFYEFDYPSNSFTQINAPGGGTTINEPCYIAAMLDLPDGTVLYSTQNSTQYYIYSPGGTPLASWKPSIGNIVQNSCTTYMITGTLFNGISEGAAYGDDWQMASNYPIIRLTSGSNVYYARTYNWNGTGVSRGSLADSTLFTLPGGLPAGTYSLVVAANGISSDPITFVYPNVSFSGLAANYISSDPPVTLTGLPPGGIFSGPGISGNTFSPANAGVGGPYTITYTYCSNSSSHQTTVTNCAVAVAGAITGPSSVCAGSSGVAFNIGAIANATSYNWNLPAGASISSGNNTNSITVNFSLGAATGTISVFGSNGACNGASSSKSLVVNPLPAVTASNVNGCAGTTIALSGTPAGGTWSAANPYSGASTTYTHTYTDVNGCTNTSSLANITVNPLPTVTANNVSGCAGTSIALSGTPSGGIWSVANPYSGVSTTYTHTYTDVNGCTNTSSSSNITVNPLPTVTAANLNGCVGTAIALSGTPSGGTWSVANPYSGSSTSYTHTYTDVNGCANTSSSANIMVNPLPVVTADNVSGCAGTSIALSGAPIGGTWSASNPYSGSSTTYTHIYTDMNGCTNTSSSADITVNPLPIVTANDVSGCAGNSIVLSGAPNGGTWSVANPYAGTSTVYMHTYTDVNGCTNTSSSANITVNPLPIVTADNVSGCAGTSISLSGIPSDGTWSVANPYSGASTTYTHTYTDVNGCTNTSSSANITVNPLPTVNTGTYADVCDTVSSVNLSGTPIGGIWSGTEVSGNIFHPSLAGKGTWPLSYLYTDANGCTRSASTQIKVVVCCSVPVQPAAIIGSSAFCKPSAGNLYSITAVNGAVNYNWTIPTGATITSGQGSLSITIDFSSTASSGNICVSATNACGTGASQCLNITATSSKPAKPNPITGLTNNLCNATNISYSIAPVAKATSYTWTVPAGATIAVNNGTSIMVSFGNFATGNVCVTANNTCGSSASRCLSVSGTPATPASITGPATVCAHQTGVNYSCAVQAGVTYTWKVPSGASITSGQGIGDITVTWGTNSGTVKVTPSSACGNASNRTLSVSINCRSGIVEENDALDFSILPNPTEDFLNVSFESLSEAFYSMRLLDIVGHIMMTQTGRSNIGVNNFELDLSRLPKGIYMLELINSDERGLKKVVMN